MMVDQEQWQYVSWSGNANAYLHLSLRLMMYLSRCAKVNDAGIRHIVSISTLEKFYFSETGVTADGVNLHSSLKNLSVLNLGFEEHSIVCAWIVLIASIASYRDILLSSLVVSSSGTSIVLGNGEFTATFQANLKGCKI